MILILLALYVIPMLAIQINLIVSFCYKRKARKNIDVEDSILLIFMSLIPFGNIILSVFEFDDSTISKANSFLNDSFKCHKCKLQFRRYKFENVFDGNIGGKPCPYCEKKHDIVKYGTNNIEILLSPKLNLFQSTKYVISGTPLIDREKKMDKKLEKIEKIQRQLEFDDEQAKNLSAVIEKRMEKLEKTRLEEDKLIKEMKNELRK